MTGVRNGLLLVRLAAPPVEGKANEALVRFLAKALGVAQRDVQILSGETAREKRLRIAGLSPEEVQRRLGV